MPIPFKLLGKNQYFNLEDFSNITAIQLWEKMLLLRKKLRIYKQICIFSSYKV